MGITRHDPASVERRALLAAALAGMLPPSAARAQTASVLTIATVGEPSSLDPMADTSGLLSELLQPMFELLYIFDPTLRFAPVLASALPDISADGMKYTIPLRTGVPFHDGTTMTADDVVASAKRWMTVSPRGRLAAKYVTDVATPDPASLVLTLNQPYAPLLALLAFPNSALVVMPKRLAQQPVPVKEFVGTGPWKFQEHVPDRYIRVVKFPQYASPPGAPDGYAGERHAYFDELRYVPVPNVITRADGVMAGEYDFADQLTTESYLKARGSGSVTAGLNRIPTWPIIMFNTRKGIMTNPLLRLAAQAAIAPADMMAATFSDPSVWHLEGSIFPQGTAWYIPDPDGYNQHNPDKARSLLKQAGYNNEKMRFLASPQYDYMIKVAQVAQANLTDAGFNIDLQVLDWATVLQWRTRPDVWDAFVTGEGGETDPAQVNVFNPDYPGWWDSPDKRATMNAFVTATDQAKRLEIWKRLHGLFYSEAPSLKIGEFSSAFAMAKNLTGYSPMPWPAFWNVKRIG